MNTNNLLTSIALGYGIISGAHLLNLLHKALYRGNQNGITCVDFNSVGEGNLELGITITVLLITSYCFINSLGKLV